MINDRLKQQGDVMYIICTGTFEQPEAMEQLESHILEQESEITNMENRACFALHCIQLETQLVYANMEVLSSVLVNLAEYERITHSEVHTYIIYKKNCKQFV